MKTLIEWRINAGLSVRQAALAIGISRASLVAAESGKGIHAGTAKLIADFYEVKVTDIWPVPDRVAS